MSVSQGREIQSRLQQALAEAREQAARVRQQRSRLDERSEKLTEDRRTAILELAKHYLPNIERETVNQTCSGIRDELQGILQRKQRQQTVLREQLQRLEADRDRLMDDYQQTIEKLVEARKRRQELELAVTRDLAADTEFQKLSKQALETEAELLRDEERVAQIQHEAVEKLPAYENSRLFQYLYSRQLGTPMYTSRGLTRRLDRWVSGLIDYPKARGSYEFLQRTPELMQAELDRRASAFDEMMELVESIRNDTAARHGLPDVIERVEALKEQRDRAQPGLESADERCQRVADELQQLETTEGRFYQDALTRYQRYLDDTEATVLTQRAHATPDALDDEIVSRIRFLNDELTRTVGEVDRQQQEMKQAEEVASGLDFVTRRFEQLGLANEHGEFKPEFDIEQTLSQFLRGVIDRQQFLRTIRDHHLVQPGWAEKAATKTGEVLSHPLTRTLVGAMVHIAGESLRQRAQRSVRRRARRR